MYVGLVLFVVALTVRAVSRTRPLPRRKTGEPDAEARLITLGTYRAYTWLAVITVGLGLLELWMAKTAVPTWLAVLTAVSRGAVMLLALSLYWRLGYDNRRWLFVAGHLSGLFIAAEFLFALRQDIAHFMDATAPEGHDAG